MSDDDGHISALESFHYADPSTLNSKSFANALRMNEMMKSGNFWMIQHMLQKNALVSYFIIFENLSHDIDIDS